jgi:hypothetical protein
MFAPFQLDNISGYASFTLPWAQPKACGYVRMISSVIQLANHFHFPCNRTKLFQAKGLSSSAKAACSAKGCRMTNMLNLSSYTVGQSSLLTV